MTLTKVGRQRVARGLLISAVAATTMLVACGEKKDKAPSQTAAKVNKDEITVHQINFVLAQQRNIRPEQADAVSKQILERLIDQQLALQKADELKLDRDPRVVQQLDAARREVLTRAYIDKLGDGLPKPSPDEIHKYYEEKPALFRDRRIYSLQEIVIEAKPEQVNALRTQLGASKSMTEFVDFLRSNDYKFAANQAVRAAEQLPLASIDTLAKMKDGQSLLVPTPTGAQVVVLAGSRSQAVTEDQARPAIEAFLLNERKRKAAEDDFKQMRSVAKIEYVGKFVGGAASAPAGTAMPAPAAAAVTPAASVATDVAAPAATSTPASGALSSDSINKGLGIK